MQKNAPRYHRASVAVDFSRKRYIVIRYRHHLLSADTMPRTIIDLPAEQLLEVDRLCRALSISRAEAARRALQAFVREHQDVQHEGFGMWRGMRASGAEIAKTLRKHW